MSFCKKKINHRLLRVTVIISSLIIIGCAVALIIFGSIFYSSIRKYNDKLDTTIKRVIECFVIVGCIMIFAGLLGLFGSCLDSIDVLCLFSLGLFSIIIVQLGTGITCLCYHIKLKCCGSLNHLEYGDKIPSSCHEDGSIYKNGCTDALNRFSGQFLRTAIVLSLMFIILEVVAIGCSIYLAAYIDAKDQR
ncbi:unnamed protein product [Schistosoma rodhaini]|uniref:Tetraspanin n=1 Tax=Schistosoma rodhaini TaxID=6188 RepID=A0AA85ETK8_9TREM|nr:unnamed protein product [Schistosoma rodhaini]